MGDRTNATQLCAMSKACLPSENGGEMQDPGAAEVAARTAAELARISYHLGDSEEARNWLRIVGGLVKSLIDPESSVSARIVMADVLMSMRELDAAFAVVDALRDSGWGTSVLGRIIAHDAFTADSETIDRVLSKTITYSL